MNYIKKKHQSRHTSTHMQDIMRIRLNGVDELKKFHLWIALIVNLQGLV